MEREGVQMTRGLLKGGLAVVTIEDGIRGDQAVAMRQGLLPAERSILHL